MTERPQGMYVPFRHEMPKGWRDPQARQARADIYYRKVEDGLRDAVHTAEISRQETDYAGTRQIVNECASEERQDFLNRKLDLREKKEVDVKNARRSIDLGMAHLFRIGHVNDNSYAQAPEGQDKRTQLLEEALHYFYRHQSVERTTGELRDLNGNFMAWGPEIYQDLANTWVVHGKLDGARRALSAGLAAADGLIEKYRFRRIFNKRASVGYFSALSARGVLKARLGRTEEDLGTVLSGWLDVARSHGAQPNPHRLATLSLWLGKAAIDYQAFLPTKAAAVTLGSVGLLEAKLFDAKAATRAKAQGIKEGTLRRITSLILSTVRA